MTVAHDAPRRTDRQYRREGRLSSDSLIVWKRNTFTPLIYYAQRNRNIRYSFVFIDAFELSNRNVDGSMLRLTMLKSPFCSML
jgi:hypothetical protein